MKLNGQCHCGAVRFTADLTDGLASARRCDCSLCTMRGAVAVSAALDGLTITQGADNLTLYQFNTRVAEHYFCKTCGIYTHHRRRSNPNEYGVNLACLEGQSPWQLPEITVNDGQQHPNDGGPPNGVAGILRYEAYR
ncbi:GFA family protein [Rhodobacteraceae bacterium N5(2021)]|uniref:GFA family protein n=1 Tax=Gymnodinialimonas phycosphaerae TaxID=2841589 RepID=A0A975TVA6_9RHOB|nr:GFA family protein [Gymnodinialimonas phycosphaerae]MBY4891360.1 GFA family protein [Gymnodinialimonas phycosphaerae]